MTFQVHHRLEAGSVSALHMMCNQLLCWSRSITQVFELYPMSVVGVAAYFYSSLHGRVAGWKQWHEMAAGRLCCSQQSSHLPPWQALVKAGGTPSHLTSLLKDRVCWSLWLDALLFWPWSDFSHGLITHSFKLRVPAFFCLFSLKP